MFVKNCFLALILGSFLAGILTPTGCRPTGPEYIPLPTRICVRTQHHHQPIPHAKIFIKYNSDSFPGYDKPASYFDQQVTTDANARACMEPVPEGRHWLVAIGYDSLYFPHDVFGSMQIEIALGTMEKVDTIFYVSE
jgi:hypothetical protein